MNEPLLLVGGGGHAKVIADMLRERGIQVGGCICPQGSSKLDGVPWLGEDRVLPDLRARGMRSVHIAVGDNALRRKLAQAAAGYGFVLESVISNRSIVSSNAIIEPGAAIMPGAIVNTHARIGECAVINTGASVDHDCRVGSYAHIAPGCHLAGNVVIGEGAFLGTGCIVIPEIPVGDWTIVGAGAVVVRPLANRTKAIGVPARVIKTC